MQYSRKNDYSLSFNKKAVQHTIFNQYKSQRFKKLVGLAGPNINDYFSFLKSKGIKQAEVYEYDISKLAIQLSKYQPVIKSEIKYQDIYHADPDRKDTVYDLDFCCSIRNAAKHVKKFTCNVVVTLSIRPIGLKKTIKKFAKLVDGTLNPEFYLVEVVSAKTGSFKIYRLNTDTRKYQCYIYKDSMPMLTIQSITS